MSEQPASPPGVPQWDTADRITKSLRHAGVSTAEIAGYLGVSRQTIGNWTHGRFEPPTAAMRLIAMRCGVSYEWLRTGKTDTENGGPDPGPGTFSQFDGGRSHRSLRPCKSVFYSPVTPIPLTAGAAA